MEEMIVNEVEKVVELRNKASRKLGRFVRILGPGVITGAADDDPSGIATYAQTGAQFGYGQLWTMLWIFPLMRAVQEHCARIGAVTGQGLASVVRRHYSKRVLYLVVSLVLVANVINIGADIGAMAEAANLIFPGIPSELLEVGLAALVLVLVIGMSYRSYARLLKWLVLTLLAYPLTALIIAVDWREVAISTLVPHFELNGEFIFMLTAVLGTTISPYLFFWQTSEIVEEEIVDRRLAQKGGIPKLSSRFMHNISIDNTVGMLVSNVTDWFILIVGAAVLYTAGVHEIKSAADAAKALEPLVQNFPNAGFIAKLIFASGVIGLGLLAVPILAGSASYAISETFGWDEGLYRSYKRGKNFYGVIILATLVGLAINFFNVDPVKAPIYSAVFNAIAAVPLIALIAHISRRKKIMGEWVTGRFDNGLVWLTFILMTAAAAAVLIQIVF
jgi:NRAMP (natural resistance-associated macrophage protein)-like metal ion transporter